MEDKLGYSVQLTLCYTSSISASCCLFYEHHVLLACDIHVHKLYYRGVWELWLPRYS